MSSRLTKKSLVSWPSRPVKTPCFAAPVLAPSTHSPPTRTVISGALKVSNCALSMSSSSAGSVADCALKLRKPSACGSITLKASTSVSACEASTRPGVNGTAMSCPAALAASSTATPPPSTMRSARDTFLPPADFREEPRASATATAIPVAAERKFCTVIPAIWVRYDIVLSPP
jgi:hypothetical protein